MTSETRYGAALRRLGPAPVAWTTVVTLAALMAYADGFVLVALQGAVGLTRQVRGPFGTWLQSSTLMLPLFVAAVLGALALVRSRCGPSLRTPRRIVAAALLIAVAGAVVGTAEVVATLADDYSVQSERLAVAHDHAAGAVRTGTACVGACAAQQQQLAVLRRATLLGGAAILAVNVVLVGWYLAFRGGRLERRRPAAPHPTG